MNYDQFDNFLKEKHDTSLNDIADLCDAVGEGDDIYPCPRQFHNIIRDRFGFYEIEDPDEETKCIWSKQLPEGYTEYQKSGIYRPAGRLSPRDFQFAVSDVRSHLLRMTSTDKFERAGGVAFKMSNAVKEHIESAINALNEGYVAEEKFFWNFDEDYEQKVSVDRSVVSLAAEQLYLVLSMIKNAHQREQILEELFALHDIDAGRERVQKPLRFDLYENIDRQNLDDAEAEDLERMRLRGVDVDRLLSENPNSPAARSRRAR